MFNDLKNTINNIHKITVGEAILMEAAAGGDPSDEALSKIVGDVIDPAEEQKLEKAIDQLPESVDSDDAESTPTVEELKKAKKEIADPSDDELASDL